MRFLLKFTAAAIALATFVQTDAFAETSSPPRVDPSYPHYQPPYPDAAQAKGEEGVVMVDVYVRPSGKPTRAKISQSSGFDDLDTAAMQGVLNWRFVPATEDGEIVSDWTTVKVVYQLPVPAAVQLPTSLPSDGPK